MMAATDVAKRLERGLPTRSGCDRGRTIRVAFRRWLARVAGDGNLLFNVGPMPTGEIEPRQVEGMKETGDWLTMNGESIYGTRGGPWKPTRAIASTRKDHTICLHLLQARGDAVKLPDIARKVTGAELLNGGKVQIVPKDGKLSVVVPAGGREMIDMIVKLQLDGSAMDLPAQEIPSDLRADASNVYRNETSGYGPQFAFDGDTGTRWAADDGTRQAWVSIDLGRPKTIQGVRIHEAFAGRVQKFEFQHRDGKSWKTIFSGTTLGAQFEKTFAAVTAREFRLNILDATEGPTIEELEFF